MGVKTSEFWMSLLSILIPAIAQAFSSSSDPRLLAAGVAVSGAYTLGRSAVKVAGEVRAAAETKAAVAAALPAFGGMTTSEKLAAAAATAAAAKTPGAP